MNKTVEHVAIAMDKVAEERGTIDWRELAAAAIEAMSEPTDEMVAAAKIELVNDYSRARYLTDLGIRKAIKAALKE